MAGPRAKLSNDRRATTRRHDRGSYKIFDGTDWLPEKEAHSYSLNFHADPFLVSARRKKIGAPIKRSASGRWQKKGRRGRRSLARRAANKPAPPPIIVKRLVENSRPEERRWWWCIVLKLDIRSLVAAR